jgi:hypothetical protein
VSPEAAPIPERSLVELAPRPGVIINKRLTLVRSDGRCVVMSVSMPLHV